MKENSESENSDGKIADKSATSKNSEGEKPTDSKSTVSFFKKLDFKRGHKSEKKEDEAKDSKDQADEKDSHAFSMVGDFLSSDKLKNIKSGKSKLVMVIGIFAGALLICSGVFLIIGSMGSPDKLLADNAEFGDTASFSVFLILIGIIVIAGVFARKFLDKSFFKGINKELESHNGTSSNSTEKEYKKG